MKFQPESHSLRVVFAGTPPFAVPSLEALVAHPRCDVVAVYTQPDRASGRGQQTQASAVKACALANGLMVVQPPTLREPEAIEALAALRPDLLVVAAYGLILPQRVIDIPTCGTINVHASLLPRWRGAAPIQRAIMAGDVLTGITIMRVVVALDAGPVILKRGTAIAADEVGGTLSERLAVLGAEALRSTLDAGFGEGLDEAAQDETAVTYARKIERADRDLVWTESAAALARRVRALNPAPLAIAELAGLSLNVWSATALAVPTNAAPGTVVQADGDGIAVATGDGVLRITELQPPGKRRMSAREFLNGYRRYFGG
ncbi:MAG: methionyl-tRNA formyltransferase [Gammaproteobacteria bacterium]|nr:methionyl-tRNA formyltransferase [Gammaproteobacteria bacterium]MBI5617847.1 methionyl-tRNA formyltransferase [Gammaproteobacteria bacterium]